MRVYEWLFLGALGVDGFLRTIGMLSDHLSIYQRMSQLEKALQCGRYLAGQKNLTEAYKILQDSYPPRTLRIAWQASLEDWVARYQPPFSCEPFRARIEFYQEGESGGANYTFRLLPEA